MKLRSCLALALLLAACGDDDGDTTMAMDMGPNPMDQGPAMDMEAADMAGDMGATEPRCEGEAALEALPASGFLVLSTDYSSTAVGVVSADASAVPTQRWVDSATAAPGLVAALSGDVVLPTTTPAGSVALVDRGNDTVTRFCADGALAGQVRVGTDEEYANPQDAVVGATEAWVSRYEPHPSAADPLNQGSDLLGLDTATLARNGERIDLSGFGGMVTGLDMEGNPTEVAIAARPQSITMVPGYLVVGLDRLPVQLFGGPRGHLPGAVAIAQADGSAVSLHEVSGLANCGRVTPIPGESERVLVSCSGYSDRFFGDTEGERATAGLAVLHVDAGGVVTEEAIWRVADDVGYLAAIENTIALDAERVIGVAWGVFGESGDQLVLTDLSTGDQQVVDTAAEAFALGEPAARGSVLLVPDASSSGPTVWRFSVSAADVARDGEISVDPVLPPRIVRAF